MTSVLSLRLSGRPSPNAVKTEGGLPQHDGAQSLRAVAASHHSGALGWRVTCDSCSAEERLTGPQADSALRWRNLETFERQEQHQLYLGQ